MDLEYIDAEVDGSRGGVSTFDNHHANVFFDATLRPNLRAQIEVEYEHSGSQVEIDTAYLSWDVNDALTLNAGRFYTPFGIERFVWYSPTNQLVTRPEAFRQIIPGNFYANGLMFTGNVGRTQKHRFTYEVALSDGLDEDAAIDRRGSRQTRDSNSSRAISGRVAVAFWPWIEIGSSYHTQRYSLDGLSDLDLDFFGFDVSARWKGWEVRTEYVTAELDQTTPTPALEQDGWYAQLSYTLLFDRETLPGITFVTRFDSVDLDDSVVGNDDRDLISVGVNLLIYEHFRFKSEYQRSEEDGPNLDNDQFIAQFVIDF